MPFFAEGLDCKTSKCRKSTYISDMVALLTPNKTSSSQNDLVGIHLVWWVTFVIKIDSKLTQVKLSMIPYLSAAPKAEIITETSLY